jgi:hypothetical protein
VLETVVPVALHSAAAAVQLVIVEQDFGLQLVVTAQFVTVFPVQVDVLSSVVLFSVVLFSVVLSDSVLSMVLVIVVLVLSVVDEFSDVDELSEVEAVEVASVSEMSSVEVPVGTLSSPCVPIGVGIPLFISKKAGRVNSGTGGNSNLPSPGPNWSY